MKVEQSTASRLLSAAEMALGAQLVARTVVWENVDMAKLQTALAQPGTAVAMTKHTVIQPVEVFVEVEGGR
jgi:hypothetical protein